MVYGRQGDSRGGIGDDRWGVVVFPTTITFRGVVLSAA